VEKSDRSSIAHKIRMREDGKPEVPNMSNDLAYRLKDHLKADKSKLSKMARVKRIYDLLDEIRHETESICVCRKGCAHCCRIKLEVTPLEADYISHNTDIKQRKHNVVRDDKYCPLLNQQTAQCSVYEFRPFNCRSFATYDSPDYCRDDMEHYITGGPENGYGSKAILFLAIELCEVDTNMRLSKKMKDVVSKRVKNIKAYF